MWVVLLEPVRDVGVLDSRVHEILRTVVIEPPLVPEVMFNISLNLRDFVVSAQGTDLPVAITYEQIATIIVSTKGSVDTCKVNIDSKHCTSPLGEGHNEVE